VTVQRIGQVLLNLVGTQSNLPRKENPGGRDNFHWQLLGLRV